MKKRKFVTSLFSLGLVPFIPNIPIKSSYHSFSLIQGGKTIGGSISLKNVKWALSDLDCSRPFQTRLACNSKYGPIIVIVPFEKLKKLVAEKSLDNPAV